MITHYIKIHLKQILWMILAKNLARNLVKNLAKNLAKSKLSEFVFLTICPLDAGIGYF